ncbi:MAG: threonine synthase [Anaerolinea sp.]|nr:threonine synthase [Anaerolinea sp.]
MPDIRCVDCGSLYPSQGVPFRCQKCGGIFDYDAPFQFSLDKLEPALPGYWQYRHAFALPAGAPVVTLGEGNTPLLWEDVAGEKLGLKFESLNPTGSYKDRGSAVLASQLLARGVKQAVEDSSGNAGASFAAYAAQARLPGRVYVPESASGPKRQQIEAYGAELVRIPGPRSEAARAVLSQVEQGVPYASHAYLPFGLAGIATIAYEIWQQMGRTVPAALIAPVGHGGLLLGIVRGFQSLVHAGLSSAEPYYVGVQAAACDPVVRAFEHGLAAMQSAPELPTLAEGVRVRTPVRARALIEHITPGKGTFISIGEAEIQSAYRQLAQRGYYVEPTSALVWAAYGELHRNLPQPAVAVLSGNGLKYIPAS